MPNSARSSRPLRVLHCPENVGGHASSLAAAERSIGLDSRCVTLAPPPFGYDSDVVLTPPGSAPWRTEIARVELLWTAMRWADVVHLNFGSSIFPPDTATSSPLTGTRARKSAQWSYRRARTLLSGLDLRLLRRMGKGVIVTFQGDDARPSKGRRSAVPLDVEQDARKQRHVRLVDQSAHAIFALNPDLLDHLPSRALFLPYANIDPGSISPIFPEPDGQVLRIVHAPTDRETKGTHAVLHAVAALREMGHRIELDLIEGESHREVLHRLQRADIVIDQLRMGWYGGFAVEAMATGKPVLGFLDPRDLARTGEPFASSVPLIQSDESGLVGVLQGLLESQRDELAALGRRSRAFVEEFHSPARVAAALEPFYVRSVAQR